MIRDRSVMRWSDTITEASAAVGRRPARTLLTALGTILGVAAFVTTTGLAATASAQVSSSFDALKATEVRIQVANPDGTNPFPDDVDQRLQTLNGIRHAGLRYTVNRTSLQPRNTAGRTISSATQPIPLIAATPGAILAAQPTIMTGVLYNDLHQQRSDRVAVLGRIAAEQLGVTRVDNQPVVFIGDTAYVVIGIIDDAQRTPELLLAVTIPTSTEHDNIASIPDDFEVIIDTLPGAADLAGRQAPQALSPQQPDLLTALVPPDPSTLRNSIESDVTSLYYALAALSLAVGTIAIANATLLSTIERRSEIGLRRALGATRSHIARQIVVEAAATGTLAGTAGAAFATIAVSVIATSKGWTTVIDPATLTASPVIGMVTGAIAGLLPALRAAQTAPAITLRA